MKKMNTKKLTTLGVLAACSIVLVAFIHFPIFPAVSFLEYDPADIPILIGTFLFGPVWGVVLTVIVSALLLLSGVVVKLVKEYKWGKE